MINDGHFHMHYFAPNLVPGISKDFSYPYDMERIRKIKDQYKIDNIVGIFIPPNLNIVKKVLDENPYIHPGIYISPEDRSVERLEKLKDPFEFIKIHNYWFFKTVEEIVSNSTSLGFKKFQIHTNEISDKMLDMIREYVRKHDSIFYLVHGVDAVYRYDSKVNVNELKKLEGNLLLGTSPPNSLIEIPNVNIKRAIDANLENIVVFESDFALPYPDESYYPIIQSVTGSVGNNEKILYENVKLFLD